MELYFSVFDIQSYKKYSDNIQPVTHIELMETWFKYKESVLSIGK